MVSKISSFVDLHVYVITSYWLDRFYKDQIFCNRNIAWWYFWLDIEAINISCKTISTKTCWNQDVTQFFLCNYHFSIQHFLRNLKNGKHGKNENKRHLQHAIWYFIHSWKTKNLRIDYYSDSLPWLWHWISTYVNRKW